MNQNFREGKSTISKYSYVTQKYEQVSTWGGVKLRHLLLSYAEKGNIRNKENLWKNINLTQEEEKEIEEFYKRHFGKEIPTQWHRLYQSYTGQFHKDYFPEYLFSTKLEPLMNPYKEAEFLSDKNLIPVLFGNIRDIHIPLTYLSCVNGRFRNSNNEYVSGKKAELLLNDIGNCVIKKTVDTSSGRDVMICNIVNGVDEKTKLHLKDIISETGLNFVIQEKIIQHRSLSKLNSTSLNTFRVMTYLLGDNVYLCPVALRLGRSSSDKDNIHAGGIVVGVNANGTLKKYAFSEYGEKYEKHPDSLAVFNGYKIEPYARILEKAKELHQRIPYLGIISWDMSIDELGTVVLIEMNTIRQSAWFPQMVNGESLFGKNTSDILQLIK